MITVTDIPAWAVEIITARATALGVTFDEALLASLNVTPLEPMAETAGWAIVHGARPRDVAARLHYCETTVRRAAHQYDSH